MARLWERWAGLAGLAFVVVVIASFFTPSVPDPDTPTLRVVAEVVDDRDGLVLGVYLGWLAAALFLAFTAGLWGRLRVFERGPGPSIMVALGGVGSAVVILVANGILLALVYAAEEGREPAAVRALFELDQTVFLALGFTSAVFYAGVALSALLTRSLHEWLCWVALVLATVFPLSALAVFSEDEEGGVLGGIFFFAVIVNFLWILVVSALLVRQPPGPGIVQPPTPAAGEPRPHAAGEPPPPGPTAPPPAPPPAA
jgi:MFS family permease